MCWFICIPETEIPPLKTNVIYEMKHKHLGMSLYKDQSKWLFLERTAETHLWVTVALSVWTAPPPLPFPWGHTSIQCILATLLRESSLIGMETTDHTVHHTRECTNVLCSFDSRIDIVAKTSGFKVPTVLLSV